MQQRSGENRTPTYGENPPLYPLSYGGVGVRLFAREQVTAEESRAVITHPKHMFALTGQAEVGVTTVDPSSIQRGSR